MGIQIGLWQVSLLLAILCGLAWAQEPRRGHRLEEVAPLGLGPLGHPKQAPRRCGDKKYWNATTQRCAACTECGGTGREVAIRPCDKHRDTVCGPLSDLNIDWSWMRHVPDRLFNAERGRKKKADLGVHDRINSMSEAEALLRDELRHMPTRQSEKMVDFGDDYILPDHPRQTSVRQQHKPRKTKKAHSVQFGGFDDFADFGASGDSAVGYPVSDDEDLLADWQESKKKKQQHHARPSPTATTTSTSTTSSTPSPTTTAINLEDFIVMKEDRAEEDAAELGAFLRSRAGGVDVVATSQTFTTAETLVWDWQAGILVAAVCACLLFFIVAAAYSCQHALHFKKLKRNLDADMEEISSRLALMSSMGSDHFQDPTASAGGTMNVNEKTAFPVRRGDHLRTGRQQNEYCLAGLPGKTRV